jgi:hypothetical protein
MYSFPVSHFTPDTSEDWHPYKFFHISCFRSPLFRETTSRHCLIGANQQGTWRQNPEEPLRKPENPQFSVCKKNLECLEATKIQLLHEEKQLTKQVYKELVFNDSSQVFVPSCYRHTHVAKCTTRLLPEGYSSSPRWVLHVISLSDVLNRQCQAGVRWLWRNVS